MRSTYPGLNIPTEWIACFDLLQQLIPKLLCQIVRWDKQKEGQIKCNTDGASKGNPGINLNGFYVRDCGGDLIYA